MIFSNIQTWHLDQDLYSDKIQTALRYLTSNEFTKMNAGEYEIDGRNIFAIVMDKQTSNIMERVPETHVKYIDIQYLVTGRESIGFSRISDATLLTIDALEEKDLLLYEKNMSHESFVNLLPGDFAIFFPTDIHRPLCVYGEVCQVRKVVVKIAVNL